MTYGGFKRMTGFCKTYVPPEIAQTLEGIKDNDEAIKNYGIDLGTQMCKRLLNAGTPGVHMYTLNLERSAVSILENVGLISKNKVSCRFDQSTTVNGVRSLLPSQLGKSICSQLHVM